MPKSSQSPDFHVFAAPLAGEGQGHRGWGVLAGPGVEVVKRMGLRARAACLDLWAG